MIDGADNFTLKRQIVTQITRSMIHQYFSRITTITTATTAKSNQIENWDTLAQFNIFFAVPFIVVFALILSPLSFAFGSFVGFSFGLCVLMAVCALIYNFFFPSWKIVCNQSTIIDRHDVISSWKKKMK